MKLAWREAGIPVWCWFWEHGWKDDGIYLLSCSRCGKDEGWHDVSGPRIGLRLNVWWWNHAGWYLGRLRHWVANGNYVCDQCHKPRAILGRRVGIHDECWPF